MLHSPLACCGRFDKPGLAVDFSQYSDFSLRETTQDQARIEEVLASKNLSARHLLHVGVGNSRFAQRFVKHGAVVEGITVSESELTHANSLNIENYRVHLLNKYCREFVTYFDTHHFDYIIDNNPAAFACCIFHFYLMLENYLRCLKPGGKILTHQRGLDWALLSPRFILNFSALKTLEHTFPIRVIQETDSVYALELLTDRERGDRKLRVHALRRYGDREVIESFEPQAVKS